MVYLDTGALVKLYHAEPRSEALVAWVTEQGESIPYTQLHELGLKNAIGLKVFRGEIDEDARTGIYQDLDADLANGVLTKLTPDWAETFSEAQRLANIHTVRFGCRSLDILHVALAICTGQSSFLTFGDRQNRLAQAAGLQLVRINAR